MVGYLVLEAKGNHCDVRIGPSTLETVIMAGLAVFKLSFDGEVGKLIVQRGIVHHGELASGDGEEPYVAEKRCYAEGGRGTLEEGDVISIMPPGKPQFEWAVSLYTPLVQSLADDCAKH